MISEYNKKFTLLNSIFSKIPFCTYERLLHLIQVDDNWDGQDAKQMNLYSIETMVSFINFIETKIPEKTAIFLNYEGNILFEPFNLNGKQQDIEFFENFIEILEEPYSSEAITIYKKDFNNLINYINNNGEIL